MRMRRIREAGSDLLADWPQRPDNFFFARSGVVVCYGGSLLTGVGASAAQNTPVTNTCSECGAVLPSSTSACTFCESPISDLSVGAYREGTSAIVPNNPAWRDELARKLEGYRVRRRHQARNRAQSELPFQGILEEPPNLVAVAEGREDFSFTIAIGRHRPSRDENRRMDIDVSVAPGTRSGASATSLSAQPKLRSTVYPVASLEERRLAALIDAICLLFAYGGFLALFGSLGGQFTLNKLSAAVYAASFAIVYLQYFALFTIFGGTTPGMMFRGLQVVSFCGDPPTPRQMLMRTAGYLLSGGTLFLGFLWAWWDEDTLTWHDRVSRTHLSFPEVQTRRDSPGIGVARSR